MFNNANFPLFLCYNFGKGGFMLQEKRKKEKQLLCKMIAIYQKKKKDIDCQRLQAYALQRIEKCPFMESKTFCSSCKNHCYQKQRREEIRKVMRYAEPRMLLYHPVLVLQHALDGLQSRKNKKSPKLPVR